MSLSRSSLALQFCIEELLRRAHGPCGFYLITTPEILNWKEVSRRHAYMLKLMRNATYKKAFPRHGGVRVFEEGEKTFRPHAHWVMTPRIPQHTIQHYADLAGMGHVWLDPRYAGQYLGMYLSKYLSKTKGSLRGVKRWSCFGEFDAVKTKDVEVTSPEIELFRSHMKAIREEGMSGAQAYTECVRRCNLSKYGHQFRDTQQGQAPEQKPAPDAETDKTLIMGDRVVEKTMAE